MEGARSSGDALTRAGSPVAEAGLAWVCVMGGLGAFQIFGLWVPFVHGLVGAAAVAAFLYVPIRLLERRGQEPRDAGWRFDRLGRDLAWSLGVCAVVLPLFTLGYVLFVKWADMTMRFEERWGPVTSAVAAAALFALGHLLSPAPWRLAVFFPALLFAWLRNRTGTIVGASIAHFLCNVWLLVLERSL